MIQIRFENTSQESNSTFLTQILNTICSQNIYQVVILYGVAKHGTTDSRDNIGAVLYHLNVYG